MSYKQQKARCKMKVCINNIKYHKDNIIKIIVYNMCKASNPTNALAAEAVMAIGMLGTNEFSDLISFGSILGNCFSRWVDIIMSGRTKYRNGDP